MIPLGSPAFFDSSITVLMQRSIAGVEKSPIVPRSHEMCIRDSLQPAWELYNQIENKRPVIVAIIDTGIDVDHPDLKDAMWVNEDEIPGDGIDNDGNGFIDDVNGWNFIDNNNQLYTEMCIRDSFPPAPAL